jgi:hypothetical protein
MLKPEESKPNIETGRVTIVFKYGKGKDLIGSIRTTEFAGLLPVRGSGMTDEKWTLIIRTRIVEMIELLTWNI